MSSRPGAFAAAVGAAVRGRARLPRAPRPRAAVRFGRGRCSTGRATSPTRCRSTSSSSSSTPIRASGASAAAVSDLSRVEQAAGADDAAVAAELERLNAAYEARFGFRYCVFVAGRSRAALLPEFRAALDADREAEIERALDAVIDIARARYATLTA